MACYSIYSNTFRLKFSNFFIRPISMSSLKMTKILEDLQVNPYYEKYANRIAELQKSSPEEFLERAEKQMEEKQKPKFQAPDLRQYSSVLNPKENLKEKVATEEKRLSDIFKTDLVIDKDPTEIKLIWEEYHKLKDVIAATIPTTVYEGLKENIKKYPMFLFPLPRTQGYEFILCQSSGNSVHFTPLLCYQVHKENAPECLTMTHYTELSNKGLILMRGEYDKNVIDIKEALCLANQFQLYYGPKSSPQKKLLLENFWKNPDNFKHTDLVAELENLTL